MSDDSQVDGELFNTDTEDTDNTAGGESNSNEQDTDSTAEEIEEELDLNKEEKPALSKGEQERQKQLEVWTSRIKNGERTIDELPANLKWMKPLLQERFKTVKEPSLEELVEKKLAEREDAQKFALLRENINSQRLTATQKKELEAEFKEFVRLGLPKSKALEKAARVVNVDLTQEVDETLRKAMQLPPLGRTPSSSKGDMFSSPDSYKNVSEQERLKKIETMRRSQFRS